MGLFFAWAVGEGIITWRWFKAKAPPTPGALLLPTALYLSLAVLAEYQPARAGKAPAQATGWPPPKMAATQIWPGGASAAAATAPAAKQTAVGKAESGASISSQIIKDLTELPGLGIIK
jgi:hypothetical protein